MNVELYHVALCMNIASKLQPFHTSTPNPFFELAVREVTSASNYSMNYRSRTLELEAEIVEDLQGDLFPQKEGLVDRVFRTFLSNTSRSSRPDIQQRMVASAILFVYALSKGGTSLDDCLRVSKEIIENPYDPHIKSLSEKIKSEDTIYAMLLLNFGISNITKQQYKEAEIHMRRFTSLFSHIPVPDPSP
jgi:hypothetical protein